MASTFGGLNTLVRGLYSQQIALSTVGHNIASADKDGYSRQQVNLMTSTPEEIYGGNGSLQLGTGVLVESINRVRDTFVDRQMWKESSTLGYGQTQYDSLNKIQEVFQEPDTTNGMQGVLNQFWSAWQTLGKDASIESGARTTVIQRGQGLVDAIQTAGQTFYGQVADINSVIDIKVDKVNELSSEILSLNKQIASIEMGNKGQANDLRDTRDNLVDQMSSIIKVSVNEDQYGHYNIQAGGITLVSATDVVKLTTVPSSVDAKYGYEVKNVMVDGSNKVLDFGSGEIKALTDMRDSEEFGIKAYLNDLDKMSQFLMQDFNTVHKTGYDTDNNPGNNFFGENDIDYSTLTLPNDTNKSTWLSCLKVNSDLLSENGAAKVAAKTLAAITQSNIDGGPAFLSGTYSGSASVIKNYTVEIAAVDDKGNVSKIKVTTSDGADGANSTTNEVEISGGSFDLGNGITLKIANDLQNKAGNTYKFTMPPQNNAAGDNAYRLAQSMKVDVRQIMGESYSGTFAKGVSLDSFYNSVIGGVGVQTQNAERLSDNQQTMVNQLNNWRESSAGVNLDEELTNMIRFQKGYNSAARVITAFDEMLDKLINGTGVVGR